MIRPLLDEDFPLATSLLTEGFPERTSTFWEEGLVLLRRHSGNAAAGVPLGLLLMDAGQPVGVALTPASLRCRADGTAYPLVNISSWYVRPAWRWRAGLMLRAMVSDPKATYIDLTPTNEVMRMLPMFGFSAVNLGTTIAALPLLALGRSHGARVRELRADDELPPHSPPLEMLLAHRDLGCVPLLLEHPEGRTLLVYRNNKPLRGMSTARLKYIGSHTVLQRYLPALARFMVSRGVVLATWDTRAGCPRTPGSVQRTSGLWFARGQTFDDCTDFIGTEVCILGV